MKKIVVVDYGMGNLLSVARALHFVAPDMHILVSSHADDLKNADRIILPGQGAMPDCMASLEKSGLKEALLDATKRIPILGICVGEQMLLDWSEEGETKGLGLISGKVVHFRLDHLKQPDGSRYKIPQMGWNEVIQTAPHPLWKNIANKSFFYFVHSFYAIPNASEHVASTTEYGISFCSALAYENIFATQFHPEKSASAGLQLYENFIHWHP